MKQLLLTVSRIILIPFCYSTTMSLIYLQWDDVGPGPSIFRFIAWQIVLVTVWNSTGRTGDTMGNVELQSRIITLRDRNNELALVNEHLLNELNDCQKASAKAKIAQIQKARPYVTPGDLE